jgi:hypothetical protein
MEDREHAKLSASGAKRWMACPRSVALEEEEEERESPFAIEGTQAHAVAEVLLRNAIGELDGCEAEVEMNDINPPKDMIDYVGLYVEGCVDSYETAKLEHPNAIALVEVRVEYTDWVPEGFGTCDFMVIAGNRLIIRDMKYGKGVPVSAEDNPQIRIYALGAIQEFGYIFDIEEIEMHIDQPRLNAYTTEIITTKELLKWAEKEVKPKAKLAYNDKGAFVSGDHCKFCRVRATCKKRACDMLEIIQDIIIGGPINGKR